MFHCALGFVTGVGTCFMHGGCVVISIRRVVIAQQRHALLQKNILFQKRSSEIMGLVNMAKSQNVIKDIKNGMLWYC